MARDLSNITKAQEAAVAVDDRPVFFHDRTYPAGHPEMPEGGRVVEMRWADGEQICFVQKNGAAISRRTVKMWGWDGRGDA